MKRRKLAILSTHPIQYHRHWFQALAELPNLDIEVLFCHQESAADQAKSGFGVEFKWDTPLLDGYPYRFLKNVAKSPSACTFSGLDTPEIQKILIDEGFDAVMINGWHFKSAWQAIWACWRHRIPVMVRSDSHLHTPRPGWKQNLKNAIYPSFISRLDACLSVGQWSAEYFRAYRAKPGRIFHVPHAIDDSRLLATADQHDKLSAREKWRLRPDSRVFLFAAKFIPKKRPMDFIQAIERASAASGNIVGLMVGDGPLRPACEDYVREHSLPVRFTGFLNQSEIGLGYAASDMLVLPSDGEETWGLVVNEAMICGLGCIVSDQVGCGPDLIVRGHTGDIYKMGDVAALAEKIVQYAGPDVNPATLGALARQRVAERYSLSAAVDGVLSALDVVLAE